jgi:hypothetical protein
MNNRLTSHGLAQYIVSIAIVQHSNVPGRRSVAILLKALQHSQNNKSSQ